MPSRLDQHRLSALRQREEKTFQARITGSARLQAKARMLMPDGVPMSWMAGLYDHAPLFVAGGEGSRFADVDGNHYIDFNLADLSNTIGYGANAVSDRLAAQAARGIQHLLPTEDAIAVAAELKHRTGFPFWQFTVSASGANMEVIRIARAFTGRNKIVVFEGKYHGHIDPTMVEGSAPEAMGIPASATRDTIVVPFNDAAALAKVLAQGDVALVMTEPTLTNCALVLPDQGFLAEVWAQCQKAGVLLSIDETHSWQFAYGGLTRAEGLQADFIALGKGLGTGAPLACYGMTAPIAAYLEQHRHYGSTTGPGLAIGGTTYGNALTMAAARAMLEEIATEAGYERIAGLGRRLADGITSLIARYDLPWRAFSYGPRTGFCLTADLPRNAIEALPSMDRDFSAARRLYMANRGIWDAISSAGPQVSFAHDAADIDRYIAVASDFLAEVVMTS
jgi:glutamate-1-semialdehyde 2,1-aminomutase